VLVGAVSIYMFLVRAVSVYMLLVKAVSNSLLLIGAVTNSVFLVRGCCLLELFLRSLFRTLKKYVCLRRNLLILQFFFFGATTPIWALAYLHETLRFTSFFYILDSL
jgi:hypothetical protein